MKYYLAIDLGASSGRHIIGFKKDNEIILEEVHRFKTLMDNSSDGLIWDIDRIFKEIKIGIKKAFEKYPNIESLSIDTWGVDYVLMNNDKEIYPVYAYRNSRCIESAIKVHKIIDFKEIYKRCGIQFQPFNTIYQLFWDKENNRLENTTDYLMVPSYFIYKLTGIKTHEYTNETTTSLLNASSKAYDLEIIDKLKLPRKLFNEINNPGKEVGDLLPEVQKEVNGNLKVILCASHDTASAFEAIEEDENTVIISSGTWSLLGIKLKKPLISEESLNCNYTNEGGVNYIRFLKNIMGMYLVNKLADELNLTIIDVINKINESSYTKTFNVNDSSLNDPNSMKDAIIKLLKDDFLNDIDLFSSIYHSLAKSYSEAIKELEKITNKKFNKVLVIGGGANNNYLNSLIKLYTKLKVEALPIEATALGNIKVQIRGN